MHKINLVVFVFFVVVFFLVGCSVSSSGNMMGEASVLKYSTDEKKYHFIDVGMTFAGAGEKRYISSPHHDVAISGGSLNVIAGLFSYDYSICRQKGGVFLSLPLTIPLDIGIRPSIVQWLGSFYLGASISFVGGFYPNEQNDDYEPEADDSFGRFDGFILYNFGGGALFDVGEKFALGAYVNYERMAMNSGGSTVKNYDFPYMDVLSEDHGKENLPAYAKRANVITLGLNTFIKMKNPLGFYIEYSPSKLMYNGGWWKIRVGSILLY